MMLETASSTLARSARDTCRQGDYTWVDRVTAIRRVALSVAVSIAGGDEA